jgi:hypothetical protein
MHSLTRTLRAAVLSVSATQVYAQQADSVFTVSKAGKSLLRVNVDGNVGIGTSTPSQRLTVDGGVKADSATLKLVRFADGSTLSSGSATFLLPSYNAGFGFGRIDSAPLVFYKDSNGIVHFDGFLHRDYHNTHYSVAFTLPPGYRPRADADFPVAEGYFVTIRASGEVLPWPSNPSVWLGGISFIGR